MLGVHDLLKGLNNPQAKTNGPRPLKAFCNSEHKLWVPFYRKPDSFINGAQAGRALPVVGFT